MGTNAQLPLLFPRDAFLAIALSAVGAHLVFKKWEPKQLRIVSLLLLFVPACLSALLVPHYGALRGIPLCFATYWSALSLSILFYRLGPLHPLSRYPGPLPAKVTKLWHAWQVHAGKQHLYLQRLHDKYGDIVRIGPNEVSIRDASCIMPILGSQGMPKSDMFLGRNMWPETAPLIGYRDPAEHMKRRKPWSRAFSSAAVREFEPIIQQRVHQLVEALGARQGQVVDFAEWISFFTYDFMGDMVFGGWTEMMRDGADQGGLWDLLRRGLVIGAFWGEVPWVSYYAKKLPWIATENKAMRVMAFSRTEQRYASGSASKDLFYYLSNEDGAEKTSPPRNIVIGDGLLALVAGSDTTATVVANTMYELLRHPNIFKRLQAEVDKFYPPGEDSLDAKHIKDMHYLEAVINEGLRMYPAVPSGSHRAPEVGKGGKAVGPYFIPEGTQTRVHFWSIHRDARNFSCPETFWPERWLVAEGVEALPAGAPAPLVHNANAFTPFSFGPYNCVGKNIALAEMKQLLCHLVQKLEIRFADGVDPETYTRAAEDHFVYVVGKLPVVVRRRD
ncbi:cytochrome P450 [Phanerochaete sordida]|uniref:Cytochrome P450 n=1 Tax=Phanerochaete sordida TaxID=48140 RepID=A0A9P3G9A7_9APHY|nr:cytochrome P450 [Phanerochaete sordida]